MTMMRLVTADPKRITQIKLYKSPKIDILCVKYSNMMITVRTAPTIM